ncbi:hypothetical protein PHJA_002760400, partial [Phtheirospermum japonicum]
PSCPRSHSVNRKGKPTHLSAPLVDRCGFTKRLSTGPCVGFGEGNATETGTRQNGKRRNNQGTGLRLINLI